MSLNFIRELTGLGYTELTPEELIRTRDHGVSASYIRRMKDKGFDVSLDEYVRLRDRGEREE